MADYAFKGYDNFVLEEKIESILETKMDMNRFMTANYSLESTPGMVYKVHTYVGSGVAEDLDRLEGNSQFVDAEFSEREYRVKRTQAAARWADDDQMTDPVLIDTKVKTVAEVMVNNWTDKAIAEFDKTSNQAVFTDYGLADFADAIAKYTNVYEDQAGLFFLANIELIPVLRKKLGDYLMYTEAYIRTGAVGSILGVPIYTSKAIPKGMMYLATKDAVTAFFKKGVFVEQDRDIDKKENFMNAARYTVIALTDESKCIKCGKAMAKEATITAPAAADVAVAGQAATGAEVKLYVNDEYVGKATAASNAYSISCDALAAGDEVRIEVSLEGYLPEVVKATAA